MRQTSRARWLLSGLMAGVIIDSIQYLLDSFAFSENWDALAKVLTPNPAEAVVTVTPTKIVALMQLVGLAAGMLAVRLNTRRSRGRNAPRTRNAVIAWLPTYGLVCIAIFLIGRGVADPTLRPVKLVHGISFALSGLFGCWAGSWFGTWVHRESEEVAAEKVVEA